MSEAVVYEQLDEGDRRDVPPQADADLRRLSDVPMEASVEIGRTSMTVGETLQLRPGAVVVLDRLAGEPADLLLNGTLIARGEVVIVDDQFGLRIAEIVEDDPDAPPAGARGAAPPTRPEALASTGAVGGDEPGGGDAVPEETGEALRAQDQPAGPQESAAGDGGSAEQ